MEALLVERRARQEFEAARAAEAEQSVEERARARKRIIEEERQRMLQEHAVRLLGHLPKVRACMYACGRQRSELGFGTAHSSSQQPLASHLTPCCARGTPAQLGNQRTFPLHHRHVAAS